MASHKIKLAIIFLSILFIVLIAISNKNYFLEKYLTYKFKPLHNYQEYDEPKTPDYADLSFWAAHPQIDDMADKLPISNGLKNMQDSAEVDVFYVHPTTFLDKKSWNASAKSPISIGNLDPIFLQATVFNGSARIFAPRYRQATIYSFLDDSGNSNYSFATARKDVISAFIYYLAHYNQGRPYFIAGHSQGSMMLIPVLKYIDRHSDDRFIAAYVPGWSISSKSFDNLKACDSPTAIKCFNVWNAKKWGATLDEFLTPSRYIGSDCVNPLSWKNNEDHVSKDHHLGAIGILPNKVDKHYVSAKCHGEMLWVDLPSDPNYEAKLNRKNYHRVDYGLFYLNIRENIKQRIEAYKASTTFQTQSKEASITYKNAGVPPI